MTAGSKRGTGCRFAPSIVIVLRLEGFAADGLLLADNEHLKRSLGHKRAERRWKRGRFLSSAPEIPSSTNTWLSAIVQPFLMAKVRASST